MTPSEFKTQFPEFTSEPDARVQLFIDRAQPYFDVARWGGFYADGVASFAAHSIKSANHDANTGGAAKSGAVQSKTVGDVSVSYAAAGQVSATDAALASTSYGQNYLRLRRMAGLGILAV